MSGRFGIGDERLIALGYAEQLLRLDSHVSPSGGR